MFGRRTHDKPGGDTGTAPTTTKYTGTGVWPAVVIGLLLAVALVIFVAQNGHAIALEWLWLDFRISPAALVLVTAIAAVAADELVGAAWRRRRRRILSEREELEHLRRHASPPASSTPTATTPPPAETGPTTRDGESVTNEPEIDLRREAPRTMRR
jgi:uncharacterized integral membrane protein